MSTDVASTSGEFPRFEQLRYAREILRTEGRALIELSDRLHDSFCDAVRLILQCTGNVIVTGMGKAGLIGQKITATLASTGTSSHFLHPAEAIHGDLGRVAERDIVLALSLSGETEEVTRLVPSLHAMRVPLIAVTGSSSNTLGRAADIALDLGPVREACSLGLAPSTSTTMMLALGDALALVASRMRGFRREDFARFHPGGSLGRKLARVEEVMRSLDDCRVAEQTSTVRHVLVQVSRPGRRTGAIMLVDDRGTLVGIFTDSDLARMLETTRDTALDRPIEEVMTRAPTTVLRGTHLSQAVGIFATRKISELPVVDERGVPVGLVDITDVVGLGSESPAEPAAIRAATDEWRTQTVRFPNP